MATSKTSEFYYRYKKKDIVQAIEYMQHLQPGCIIPHSHAHIAVKTLETKAQQDKYSDHEVRIFNKFIELGGVNKVARFYGIPAMHVSIVVRKVRNELKQQICKLN